MIVPAQKLLERSEYLENPCRVSSIPYWKTKLVTVPDGMLILHQDDYDELEYLQYIDEPYFRLSHDLQGLSAPSLPQGYSLCDATLGDFARHINRCYDHVGVSEAELQNYTARPVYDPSLWLAVKDNLTSEIVASGIGELDREIGEGVLEWIQVSEEHRGRGLGVYIVSELLWRMSGTARFATVSGQRLNPTNPEALYRRCGFVGSDIWHFLRKRESISL